MVGVATYAANDLITFDMDFSLTSNDVRVVAYIAYDTSEILFAINGALKGTFFNIIIAIEPPSSPLPEMLHDAWQSLMLELELRV